VKVGGYEVGGHNALFLSYYPRKNKEEDSEISL
jgi:hypothetical protein